MMNGREGSIHMDSMVIFIVVAFFATTWGLVEMCERLGDPKSSLAGAASKPMVGLRKTRSVSSHTAAKEPRYDAQWSGRVADESECEP